MGEKSHDLGVPFRLPGLSGRPETPKKTHVPQEKAITKIQKHTLETAEPVTPRPSTSRVTKPVGKSTPASSSPRPATAHPSSPRPAAHPLPPLSFHFSTAPSSPPLTPHLL